MFNTVKETAESNTKKIAEVRNEVCELRQGNSQRDKQVIEEVKAMSSTTANLNSITDLKARSMRDNLVFSGIEKQRGEKNTEACLQDFIKRKLKPDYEISFERVHRIGKWNELTERPLNIMAKFTFFKDSEFGDVKLRNSTDLVFG